MSRPSCPAPFHLGGITLVPGHETEDNFQFDLDAIEVGLLNACRSHCGDLNLFGLLTAQSRPPASRASLLSKEIEVEGDRVMHVYVFHGSGLFGFTSDPSASNLPPDKGPWTPHGRSVLDVPRDSPFDRPLVNEAEMLSAIESRDIT